MSHAREIHDAALVLLKAHEIVSRISPVDRTPFEAHVATMGRNRLKSIVRLSRSMTDAPAKSEE